MERARYTPGQETSDEALMRRLAAGQQDALAPLHGRYAPLIFNLAAQTLGQSAAEEIVQEVFLAVWRRAASFDPAQGPFRPWLLQLAHWRIHNELRGRGRRPQPVPDPDGLRLLTLPDPHPAPDETAWREYRRDTVRAAIEALPPPQRQALRLAFFEELTHEQIADFLGVPLGTTKYRIRAALSKLRVQLATIVAVVLVGTLGAFGVRYHVQEEARQRDERALRLVTVSDLVPIHLPAAPGVPEETHGSYRSRPGSDMAVLSTSNLAPAPAGQTYRAWARINGQWVALGTVRPDATGRAILIAEAPILATPPDAVQVTLEPRDNGTAPTGPPVISWAGP
jgi:RNA polymerase sigma factor (sigma-70 family)